MRVRWSTTVLHSAASAQESGYGPTTHVTQVQCDMEYLLTKANACKCYMHITVLHFVRDEAEMAKGQNT